MSGWDEYLEGDEVVLWQGQPVRSVPLTPARIPFMIFGILFSGFALFWMVMAARDGALWQFGLIHFMAGILVGFGPHIVTPFMRRNTWYSLTTRRAFFAQNHPLRGRTLNAVTITPQTGVDFDGDSPGTIRFRGAATAITGARALSRPAFDRIVDAGDVFRMIRDIQRGVA